MIEFLNYNNFIKNEYYYRYIDMIESSIVNNMLFKIEGENHHIMPKSIKGSNNKNNIVKLTYKEHYIAHELLPYFCIDIDRKKMLYAWNMMVSFSKELIDENIYAYLKKEWKKTLTGRKLSKETKEKLSKAMLGKYKGKNSPNYGKHHSDKTKQKISDANKGKPGLSGEDHPNFGKIYTPEERKAFGSPKEKHPLWGSHCSKETKKKISDSNKGYRHTDDFKKNCSIRQTGENNVMYGKHHTEKSIEKMKISISKIPKQKCIYCGIETTPGNIKRWHNKNCKLNDSFWEEW